jgi:hypothetical protein
LEIIRKKHKCLIQTVGLISTLLGAYETEIIPETIGALPSSDIVAGSLGVSPVPRPRPDNLVMGRSPIGPTVTVSTQDALTTPQTFGALPEGVTQQMITDSQNDGEYGYYNNDGSYVPKEIDKYNGGGPDYSGVRFRFWWRRSVRSRWRSLSFKNRNAYW